MRRGHDLRGARLEINGLGHHLRGRLRVYIVCVVVVGYQHYDARNSTTKSAACIESQQKQQQQQQQQSTKSIVRLELRSIEQSSLQRIQRSTQTTLPYAQQDAQHIVPPHRVHNSRGRSSGRKKTRQQRRRRGDVSKQDDERHDGQVGESMHERV